MCRSFAESLNRFNDRWRAYLQQIDLTEINRVRADYNKYYVLEKSCAFDSEYIGRRDFVPLRPIAIKDVVERLPPFRLPRFR